jgi:hypothetical protein
MIIMPTFTKSFRFPSKTVKPAPWFMIGVEKREFVLIPWAYNN